MKKEILERIKKIVETTIDELEYTEFVSSSLPAFRHSTKEALNAMYKYYTHFIKHVYNNPDFYDE